MRPRVFCVAIAGGSDAASRFENFSMGQPVFAPGSFPSLPPPTVSQLFVDTHHTILEESRKLV